MVLAEEVYQRDESLRVVPADALDWPLKALVLRRIDITDHHPAPLRPDWRISDSELCQTF
jgi:hypothetical protein